VGVAAGRSPADTVGVGWKRIDGAGLPPPTSAASRTADAMSSSRAASEEAKDVADAGLADAQRLDDASQRKEGKPKRAGSRSAATSRDSSPSPASSPRKSSGFFWKSHKRSMSDDPQKGKGVASPPPESPDPGTTYSRIIAAFDTFSAKQQRQLDADAILQSPEFEGLELDREQSQDIANQIKTFLKRFEKLCRKRSVTVEDMSKMVLRANDDIAQRVNAEQLWLSVDDEVADSVVDSFEKYIASQIYDLVFTAQEEDESKDLMLQERIREFRWIEPQHLDAVCDLSLDDVTQDFYKAQEELIVMDAKRPPVEKLNSVVAASKAIFGILEKSSGGTNGASADDFLPVLIYVVLQANPPMLYSNLQFLNRFCNPDKLSTGEAGYYFTNLYSAVSFVETLDASSLKISEVEFHRQMHGANSYKSLPPVSNNQKLRGFLKELDELREQQEAMEEMVASLVAGLDRMKEPAASGAP